MGYERKSSSVSMARKFLYSIVEGFWNGSESDIAGISTGNPPACQTPRLTSSALSLKWAWQGFMSLQVLMIPTTGFPL